MTKRTDHDCRRKYFTPADRIHLNIAIDPATDCWNWQGAVHHTGYGCFTISAPMVNGQRPSAKFWLAHRWSYVTFVGPIPEDHEIDHLCRNRRCVNPEHLEPVTHTVNVQRGSRLGGKRGPRPPQELSQHCRRGHAFTPENTGMHKGYRRCMTCMRAENLEAARRYRARLAAKRTAAR